MSFVQKAKGHLFRQETELTPETWRLAVHEAGHCVCNNAMGIEVRKVFLKAQIAQGGCEINQDSADRNPHALLLSTMAGMASEKLAFGKVKGGTFDYSEALDLATAIGGPKDAPTLMAHARERAEDILRAEWPSVIALANELVKREQLWGQDCRRIIREASLTITPPVRTGRVPAIR